MSAFFLLMGLGPTEIILIAVVGLLLFGRRLPEVGRSVGKSFFELKRGLGDMSGEMQEMRQLSRDVTAKPPPQTVERDAKRDDDDDEPRPTS